MCARSLSMLSCSPAQLLSHNLSISLMTKNPPRGGGRAARDHVLCSRAASNRQTAGRSSSRAAGVSGCRTAAGISAWLSNWYQTEQPRSATTGQHELQLGNRALGMCAVLIGDSRGRLSGNLPVTNPGGLSTCVRVCVCVHACVCVRERQGGFFFYQLCHSNTVSDDSGPCTASSMMLLQREQVCVDVLLMYAVMKHYRGVFSPMVLYMTSYHAASRVRVKVHPVIHPLQSVICCTSRLFCVSGSVW